MDSKEIRKKFLDFFAKRGHKIVPSSSLIPDDPSVLLTPAGMQQFKKYFTGELNPEKDFGGKNAVSIQKCFRTSDIDEVGDESHLTFFEMLGNFSFGKYFKKETINWTYELLTKLFKISAERVSATVFEGDEIIPFDKESFEAWSKILPSEQIRKGPRVDNVWGPVGVEGPCGACNEVYVDDMEVATLVFMEYYCHTDKKLTKLLQKGVDVGWGFERLTMISQKAPTIFDTDLFEPIFEVLPKEIDEKIKRIFADHARGICFLIADGVRSSNKEAGYVLRKLMRRLIAYRAGIDFKTLCYSIARKYENFYPGLNSETIISVFEEDRRKFLKTLENGTKELNKFENINAKVAFKLYESFGLPYETIKDVAGEKARNLTREDFEKEFARHQEISRAGSEKKFGGHGLPASLRESLQAGLILNTGELKAGSEEELKKVTRLHTATHLLQKALREILGNEVEQRGSDITPERTRFDFSYPRKLTAEEIKKVEDSVNQKIKEDLPVNFKEMPKTEAEKTGALFLFKEKYPEKVKIYFTGDSIETAWSKEFCGGPHTRRTSEIGEFRILREESVAAGVRRIRAVVK